MIHSSSIIAESAKIGKNVQIGPFCVIGDNVDIGDNCVLTSHVVIKGHSKIGIKNMLAKQPILRLVTTTCSANPAPFIAVRLKTKGSLKLAVVICLW